MLGHKTSLCKFKKMKSISSIFSNHNAIRLEINYKEKTAKNKHRMFNNMLPNDQQITAEIKEEIKKIPRDKRKHTRIQNLWDTAK